MRKRIIDRETTATSAESEWLDLDTLAAVEVTSEDAAHPIERALVLGENGGWRAATPGEQTLTIRFDEPRRVTRISLLFVEESVARTQELALSWSSDGKAFREIVRQQWNFSPTGATREEEDYRVDLPGATAIMLVLRPSIGDPAAIASLTKLRLA